MYVIYSNERVLAHYETYEEAVSYAKVWLQPKDRVVIAKQVAIVEPPEPTVRRVK